MKQLNYVILGGKRYPMSFSLFSMQIFDEKYGSINNITNIINKKKVDAKMIATVVELAECMIQTGCEYCNEFGYLKNEMDPVDENGKLVPLNARQILLLCGIKKIENLANAVTRTMNDDQKKKIHTKQKKAEHSVKKNQFN